MNKIKHWLVTAHAQDCEDETHYVLAGSALKAENAVKKHIEDQMREENQPTEEVYVTMVAELPGPPVRIYVESHVTVKPKPINEIT